MLIDIIKLHVSIISFLIPVFNISLFKYLNIIIPLPPEKPLLIYPLPPEPVLSKPLYTIDELNIVLPFPPPPIPPIPLSKALEAPAAK